MHDYTVGKRLELKRLALKAAMVFAFSSSDIMPRAHIVSRCLIKATPSAARAAQSVRHGSRSRAPSVVCSGSSATKGAQHCSDDKASDILPACCKNWMNGIDSADRASDPRAATTNRSPAAIALPTLEQKVKAWSPQARPSQPRGRKSRNKTRAALGVSLTMPEG